MSDVETDLHRLFRPASAAQAGTDSRTGLPRVLLVDDEPSVLSGLRRLLNSYFSITVAEGGQAGLEIATNATEPFAVMVTDMRMPQMDGVTLLSRLRDQCPDTIRMLLTGFTDMDSAIAAVNEGNVFRFLTKPADPNQLRQAITAGVAQYRLVVAERELLEGTLRGAVGALIETLSLANPVAFSRALRIRGIASELLDVLGIENRWEIEVAAMLAQVGAVTLTPTVADKLHRGLKLSDYEQAQVSQLPEVAAELLAAIPRIDGVRELIIDLTTWKRQDTPIGTRLIQLATDVESYESRGMGLEAMIAAVNTHAEEYGEDLVKAFSSLNQTKGPELEEVSLQELKAGRVLGADIYTNDGTLLVGRGQVVTESLLLRLENFARSGALTQEMFFVVGNLLNR